MNSAATMFLVSCVSRKHSKSMPARDLYCSDWFIKARAYVERQDAPWFILSAKYGLLKPDEVIQPYNLSIYDLTAKERREWADRVLTKLRAHCRPGMKVVLLVGQAYREHLMPALKSWGCAAEVPMKGLGIGQQLAWLKRRSSH